MSSEQDITNEKRSATEGAVCRTVLKKQARADRAYVTPDKVHHHNERVKSQLDSESDYDVEGIVPRN